MIRSAFMTHSDICPKGVEFCYFFAVVGWPGTLYVAKDNGEHFNV